MKVGDRVKVIAFESTLLNRTGVITYKWFDDNTAFSVLLDEYLSCPYPEAHALHFYNTELEVIK